MPLSAVLDEVKPVAVQGPLAGGSYLYTFPKNFVGTVRVQALPSATAGSNITVLLGEWLVRNKPAPSPPPPPPAPPALCAEAGENAIINLGGCKPGTQIAKIEFASFGTPTGSCAAGGFQVDPKCNANRSVAFVAAACIGKSSCHLVASTENFGGVDPCLGTRKRLAAVVQ